ncbi:MAG: Pvc16 family protein [Thiofilum sp.]|uniref:Pvc16 family protein n=1 Tax=Thiofilum sp. TaxID=2212733 RepID=UPI0025F5D74C|nr:Pvc16 family protein [Thiofilum sp.]MBK8454772.1 DUF4255 domain-containing protein [Thiofilum sp.]
MIALITMLFNDIFRNAKTFDLLSKAKIISVTPSSKFDADDRVVLNFFLFEIKENKELRDSVPLVFRSDKDAMIKDSTIRDAMIKRPPMRIDCTYLVTAWSNESNEIKVQQEHQLILEAFYWLNQFPTIPEEYLPDEVKGKLHYPIPLTVNHLNNDRNTLEFWQALGIPPRPAFYLTATIEMGMNEKTEPTYLVTKHQVNLSTDPNRRSPNPVNPEE